MKIRTATGRIAKSRSRHPCLRLLHIPIRFRKPSLVPKSPWSNHRFGVAIDMHVSPSGLSYHLMLAEADMLARTALGVPAKYLNDAKK